MQTLSQTALEGVAFLSTAKLAVIIRLPDLTNAVELAQALIVGGIKVLEFTLTSPGALEAITAVRALPEVARGEVTVGSGTVLSAADAEASLKAGAQFLITPTVKPEVIEVAREANIMVVCGAFTPTEIELAWNLGADVVKVFPSRAVGPKYLKEVKGPFPNIRLMPTGGVEREMIRDFLAAGAIAVGVGGTSLVDPNAVKTGDWAKITEAAKLFMAETR
jgi:2-dehydro-3-deoxyphosphogluconate aldolase/(4S)-4-hydroxy-2-oxoglutarate aldolase